MRRITSLSALLYFATAVATIAATPPNLPVPAEGWTVGLQARTPERFAPRCATVRPDGTLYVAGRSTDRSAGVVLRASGAGQFVTFADALEPVASIEWADQNLYVLHGTTLSMLRDADGDGCAESRIDLIERLGVPDGAGDGYEDHGPVAVRRGMDGFLYIAVGDKGIFGARSLSGETLTMQGGGIVRVRPDGSHFEVVSNGDANPAAVAVSATDDIFGFSAAEDDRWAVRSHQHVAGARFGYPYQFVAAAFRTFPPVSRLDRATLGEGTFLDDAPPTVSSLATCEPGSRAVYLNEFRKAGGVSSLSLRKPLATRGPSGEFRPRAVASHGGSIWVVDEAGAAFRFSRQGSGTESPELRADVPSLVDALDHPFRSTRLSAQDRLAAVGDEAVAPLITRLTRSEPTMGLVHALWALDAIGSIAARDAIRSRLADGSPIVRMQAARSVGVRRDGHAVEALTKLLADRDPAVRRETAIALGRMGDRSSVPALLAALGDADRTVAWCIRGAILRIGCDDRAALVSALTDPRRRESALLMADESWSVPVVEALVEALRKTSEPVVRGRILSCLAAQYRRYPEWQGEWYGPTPLAGPSPKRTQPWDTRGMAAVLAGLSAGMKDADASVRYQAAFALQPIGPPAGPILREALARETEEDNQAAIVEGLGALNDAQSTRLLLPIVVDKARPESVRAAALDALNRLRGRDVVRARMFVLYEENAPETLVARALPALARDGFLPPNDVAGFLQHASPLVRASAIMSLNPTRPLTADVKDVVLARLDDEDSDVRRAAFLAAGPLKLTEAVPNLVQKAEATEGGDHAAVLSALFALPDPRALSLYVSGLESTEPAQKRGALGALVALRDRIRDQLLKIAAGGNFKPETKLAFERVTSDFEPIRSWDVIGPLTALGDDLILPNGDIDPSIRQSREEGSPIAGQKIEVAGDDHVELGAISRVKKSAFIAHAAFDSPRERQALLLIDSDSPIEISLNGRNVEGLVEAASEGRDYVAIQLAAGQNHLVVFLRSGAEKRRFSISISAEPATARR